MVLRRSARAHGLDGLRRVTALQKLLLVYERSGGDPVTPGPGDPPSAAEIAALHHDAAQLALEYPKLVRRAQSQVPLFPAPAPAPAPAPGPAPEPPPPPVPYTLQHLAEPLFAHDAAARARAARDIASAGALARIRQRQDAALVSFFSASAPAPGAEPAVPAWEARFELDGALFVVTTPLSGLPSFVKTLDLVSGARRVTVLGSNLRSGVSRTRAAPSADLYLWSTGDFAEELGDALAPLTLPGFAADRATAFRVDAAGAGQPLAGIALAPGRAYRILVPPHLDTEGFGNASDVTTIEDGWRIVAISLPAPVPVALADRIRMLGLSVGTTGVELGFTAVPAREHRAGRRGERYPCFRPDDRPVIRVTWPEGDASKDAALFLAGPEGQTCFPLPQGEEHFVQIGPLAPGRYAADALSADPRCEPARLFFEVDEQAGRAPVPAAVVVGSGGAGPVSGPRDLAALDEATFRISTPPLWRVGARWEGERSRRLPPLFADTEGAVATGTLLSALQVELGAERIGDLFLDFGELGSLVLHHARVPSPADVGARLRALWSERGAAVEASTDLALLRSVWIEPACAALGYRVRDTTPLPEAMACALETTVREGDRITTERVAGLLVVGRGADLGGGGAARELAAKLGRRDGYARVVLTDGLRWALWERGRSFAAAAVDVREALGREHGAGEMVERFHA